MTTIDRPPRWAADPDDVPAELVARLQASVGEALAARRAEDEAAGRPRLEGDDARAFTRMLIARELARHSAAELAAGRPLLDDDVEAAVTEAVLDCVHGLRGIQPLLEDPDIRDIHISGTKPCWLVLRDGTKVRGPKVAASDEELVELVASAARRLGRSERRFDLAHPELDLRLPNGDRLHGLMGVTAHPVVTIRRHDFALAWLYQLVQLGMMAVVLAAFLAAAVRARLNIIVAGGTGTGKTTLLRCLLNEVPADERIITVEDSAELGMEHFADLHPDQEAIESRVANTEGVGEYTLAKGVRAAQRMNPDRLTPIVHTAR